MGLRNISSPILMHSFLIPNFQRELAILIFFVFKFDLAYRTPLTRSKAVVKFLYNFKERSPSIFIGKVNFGSVIHRKYVFSKPYLRIIIKKIYFADRFLLILTLKLWPLEPEKNYTIFVQVI